MKGTIENFVPKGWGYEKWIVNNDLYCSKILFFVKGKMCSYHFHKLKDETFFVLNGKVELYHCSPDDHQRDDVQFSFKTILEKGDSFRIKPGTRHRIVALEDSEILETSTQHFDSDSYRLQVGD